MNKHKLSFNNAFFKSPKPCGDFYLVQVAEAICAPNSVTEEHCQEYFEITYTYSGMGCCLIDGEEIELSSEVCSIALPGDKHSMVSSEKSPLRYYCIAFYAKKNSYGEELINNIKNYCTENQKRNIAVSSMVNLFSNILQEIKAEDTFSLRYIGLFIEQLLIECNRSILGFEKPHYLTNRSDEELLTYDIISYIDQNLESIVHIPDLEEVFFYNATFLSKVFLAQTGMTIKSYITNKKMEYANSLLKKGRSITEISRRLGYSSIHSFSRAYKNHFSKTPSSSKNKTE
ncbi:MAG: AraC family transcriptional regulator [Ruminococcaceae bacterium]|nr:AraC family transcriptional regulator [Oscillospiraceae bacterium]